jgi:hypothetical protein
VGRGLRRGAIQRQTHLLSPTLSSIRPAMLAHRRGRWRRGGRFGCGVSGTESIRVYRASVI